MTNLENTDGVTHLILKETISLKHKGKKPRGRPKEKIPDITAASVKVLEDLKSQDFLRQWDALSTVLQICG